MTKKEINFHPDIEWFEEMYKSALHYLGGNRTKLAREVYGHNNSTTVRGWESGAMPGLDALMPLRDFLERERIGTEVPALDHSQAGKAFALLRSLVNEIVRRHEGDGVVTTGSGTIEVRDGMGYPYFKDGDLLLTASLSPEGHVHNKIVVLNMGTQHEVAKLFHKLDGTVEAEIQRAGEKPERRTIDPEKDIMGSVVCVLTILDESK